MLKHPAGRNVALHPEASLGAPGPCTYKWRCGASAHQQQKQTAQGLSHYVNDLKPLGGEIYHGVMAKCLGEGSRDWSRKTVEEAGEIVISVSQELEKCRA